MTASANIKTPSMDLPLKPGPKARKRAKQLQKKFTKVTLAQVMEGWKVYVSQSPLVLARLIIRRELGTCEWFRLGL